MILRSGSCGFPAFRMRENEIMMEAARFFGGLLFLFFRCTLAKIKKIEYNGIIKFREYACAVFCR